MTAVASSVQQDRSAVDQQRTKNPRLQSTELLPTRFFARRHAIRVLATWGIVVVSLSALLCGVLIPIWLRGQRIRAGNSNLIAQSQPLAELRQKSQVMQQENQRRSKWASWVESAKPDDSLLQTLAVIAAATQASEKEIEIDSMQIQLPLEYPAPHKEPPQWASPKLLITAKVSNELNARSWLDRLNASDRIDDATSRLGARSWSGGTVQVSAKPVATRWLP